MHIHLDKIHHINPEIIQISGSKSETNRALLLQALYPNIEIENSSNSDDSEVMQLALKSSTNLIDVHHAGTAMRFLTAYFAIQPQSEVIITGSERMQQRPIKILVEALQNLGANIEYLQNEGFPPIKIKGTQLQKKSIEIDANVSSQYISALLLIAPKLPNGLEITLKGEITSRPYISMTLELLKQIGVKTSWIDQTIKIEAFQNLLKAKNILVESDWSSASYYYSIVANSPIGTKIQLKNFKENSLQADAIVAKIYTFFGVTTSFENETICLEKTNQHLSDFLILNLNDSPDIAQTIAVSCFSLGIACKLTGLHTLKIKETDRLKALANELQKLGASITIDDSSLTLQKSDTIKSDVSVATYNDHRMAMAFAPLALKTNLYLENPTVVTKSYPNFWKDLELIGFKYL